ncbi:hypothetical protein OEZ85_003275 [Tetradesmus obliquus]|uniref:Uncharacterized protein n=1 Tax=Tetradesmus obliquus TaxID=3088 RepID=A0ABY8U485_TETOB|nr:hypothetical protein OEZ85_003275 [Tetradesmus obliquus]
MLSKALLPSLCSVTISSCHPAGGPLMQQLAAARGLQQLSIQGMSLPACFSSNTGDNTWEAPRTAAAAAAGGNAALQLPGVLMQLTCLTSLQLMLTAGGWRQHLLCDSVALALSNSAQQLRQLDIQTLEVTRDSSSSGSSSDINGLGSWSSNAVGRQGSAGCCLTECGIAALLRMP